MNKPLSDSDFSILPANWKKMSEQELTALVEKMFAFLDAETRAKVIEQLIKEKNKGTGS